MATASQTPITLQPKSAERATRLAAERDCSVSELIEVALDWYGDANRLIAAIESGSDRSAPLEQLIEDYVDRMVHEARAERRAEAREQSKGQRKAS
jgi:hypothetical protein